MKTWIIVEKRCTSITGNALPIQIQWTREIGEFSGVPNIP